MKVKHEDRLIGRYSSMSKGAYIATVLSYKKKKEKPSGPFWKQKNEAFWEKKHEAFWEKKHKAFWEK